MVEDELLTLLPSLVALVREANVSRAARSVGISQPRMSARLAALRRLTGDPLLVPASGSKGLLPTDRAIELATAAGVSLTHLQRSFAPREFDPQAADRTLRIMANETATMMVGIPLVQAVRDAGGRSLRVALYAFDKTRIKGLEDGTLDLVLGRPHQFKNDPVLITRTVVRDPFVTIMRAADAPATLDLDTFCQRDHLLISTNPGTYNGIVDDELARLGRSRNIAASVESHLLATEFVAVTDLIATIPRTLLLNGRSKLALFDPPLSFDSFAVTAAWHPRASDDSGHCWLRSVLFGLRSV